MTPLRSAWIDDIDDFKAVADGWDMGLARSGEENPFLLSDFIITWWKHYSGGRRLRIFILYDGDDITGGLPLCCERRNFRRLMTYPGLSAANLTQAFVSAEGISLFREILSVPARDGLDRAIMLERVLSDHWMLADIKEAFGPSKKGRFACRISDNGFNGRIDLRQGYESVIARLNNRLKAYLKKGKAAASSMGGLRLERISGAGEIDTLFRDYRKLSVSSFRARGGVSAFESDAYAGFFGDFLKVLSAKDMVDAHRLTAGDQTLGISFGYRFGKGFKWVLTVFNPDFYRMRPGHLLIDALVREAIDRKDPYFDMYYGGEALYKKQWCSEMVPIKKVEIFADNIISNLSSATEHRLRSSGPFMRAARGARNLLHRYRNSGKSV